MPVGGKLTLKGGVPLGGGVKKKKSTKNRKAAEDAEQQQVVADAGKHKSSKTHILAVVPANELPASLKAVLNADEKKEAPLAVVRKEDQIYEKEFEMEMERAKTGRSKTTPWGSGYGKLPEGGTLHGVTATWE
eukprot:jgi/Astpho2/1961/Aster-x0509